MKLLEKVIITEFRILQFSAKNFTYHPFFPLQKDRVKSGPFVHDLSICVSKALITSLFNY